MTTNDDLSDRPGGGVMSWDDPSPYPVGPCCWRARYVRSEGRYRCSVCHPEDEPQALALSPERQDLLRRLLDDVEAEA